MLKGELITSDNSRESKIKALQGDVNVRWIVLALGVPAIIIYSLFNKTFNPAPVLVIALIVAALNIFYYFLIRIQKIPVDPIIYTAVFLDIAFVSAATFFTGGYKSSFYALYFVILFDSCFDFFRGKIYVVLTSVIVFMYSAVFFMTVPQKIIYAEIPEFVLRVIFLALAAMVTHGISSEMRSRDEKSRNASMEVARMHREVLEAHSGLQEKVAVATESLERANMQLVKKNLSLLAVHEIYKNAYEAGTVQKLFDKILGTIIPLMKANGGLIFELSPGGESLILKAIKIFGQDNVFDIREGMEIKIKSESVFSEVIKSKKGRYRDNVAGLEEHELVNLIAEGGYVISPMIAAGKVMGVIMVFSNVPEILGKNDSDLLDIIGEQAGTLVENRMLFDEMSVKAAGLEKIVKVTSAVASSLDVDEIVAGALVESIKKVFVGSSGTLIMQDNDGRLKIIAQYGMGGATAIDRKIPKDSIAGFVFMNSRHLAIKSAEKIKFYNKGVDSLYIKGAAILVPVMEKGRASGVLCMTKDSGFYNRDDIYFLNILAGSISRDIAIAKLYDNIKKDYINSIYALAAAVDAKDHYTHGHSTTVMKYSEKIALAMGLPDQEVEDIKYAALLHDIGKIGISESIINKPGRLTGEEYSIIKMHPQMGANIISKIDSLKKLVPLMIAHHEWIDGNGYPLGLRGEEIPLGGKIIAVADAYSTITSKRPYREARTMEEGIKEMRKYAGTQFDKEVVEAFVKVLLQEAKEEAEQVQSRALGSENQTSSEQKKEKRRLRIHVEGDPLNPEIIKDDESFYS